MLQLSHSEPLLEENDHFLQEEVPNEIAEALIRVIEEVTDLQTQKN